MSKVLLHACCAVCAGYPLKLLQREGFEPVVYFYNPNIYPKQEHDRRYQELVKYSLKERFELIFGGFNPLDFENIALGFENEPEKGRRCSRCFELRLVKSAMCAKDMGINFFTTTLTVSPHKSSSQIFNVAENVATQYGLEFLKYDFKKHDGFKITQQIARENNMYKQTYCGCKYSIYKEIESQV